MIDFLGIGAQKAGTTWLYTNLARHPQILFPAGKEVHFWDRRAGRSASEWLALFDSPAGVRQGEITPAYALLERGTIEEIARLCPALRLFYCVRNPIQRAWSSALMALERAEMGADEASDAWFVDHFRSVGSRRRGDYASALDRWRSVFGPEALLLVFYDDIDARPRSLLSALATHVGSDPAFFDTLSDEVLRGPQRVGPGLPIRPSLLPELHVLYDEAIDAFASVAGRDLESWKRGC